MNLICFPKGDFCPDIIFTEKIDQKNNKYCCLADRVCTTNPGHNEISCGTQNVLDLLLTSNHSSWRNLVWPSKSDTAKKSDAQSSDSKSDDLKPLPSYPSPSKFPNASKDISEKVRNEPN